MTQTLGQAVLERKSQTYLGDQAVSVREKDYSEETAREVDLEVKRLIEEAYDRAKTLLSERRSVLDEGATLLLEKETLTPDDFAPLAPKKDHLIAGSQKEPTQQAP